MSDIEQTLNTTIKHTVDEELTQKEQSQTAVDEMDQQAEELGQQKIEIEQQKIEAQTDL